MQNKNKVLMKVLKIENAVLRRFYLLYGEEETDNL